MTNSKISILGCGIGRFGAALLAKQKGFDVFVSDKNSINQHYKDVLISSEIKFEEQKVSVEKILDCNILIKSPGIPLDNEIIVLAQKKNIVILDEIAFAAQYTNAHLIGITGSNGKSTVVYMVEKILKDAGKKVEVCGNVEKSLALSIYEQHDVDFFVLELSSFQLECFNKVHLDVACIVNISENHLDHHKNFDNYKNAKLRILEGLKETDTFVFCANDDAIFHFNTIAQKKAVDDLEVQGFDKNRLQVEGKHNIIDALLAIKICSAIGISEDFSLQSLKNYKSLPYRIEFVRSWHGISFYNDSKSTTVVSSGVALEFISEKNVGGKIVWLVGGGDKGNDYTKLLKFLPNIRKIICIGKNNEKIINTFGEEMCIEERIMEKIVRLAASIAQNGDCVLLSPACTSFDLYKNFEERGDLFQKAVSSLK